MFDGDILNLIDSKTSKGVTMRQLKNDLIFSLSNEYFDSNETRVAKLTFESLKIGEATFSFNKEKLK